MRSSKQRIFEAARILFDRDGVSGISMRRIAQAVGLTPMAIYRHYAGKEALLDALMRDGFQAWEARAQAVEAPDPMLWLERFFAAFLDFALHEPRRYDAAFLLPAAKARRYPDDFAAGRSPAINLVYARVEAAKGAGLIGEAPAAEIALALSALAQGLVSMYRAGRFASEAGFRTAYESLMRRCLMSFQERPKS
jgi:AcrR family transcriptional regulator